MSDVEATKATARAWVKREQRAGRRPARPVIVLSLLGTVLAIFQAFCAASVLTGTAIAASLAGFAVAAVMRAGPGYAADRAAFAAGAAARRRIRSDTLTRLSGLARRWPGPGTRPSWPRFVVDRIEALDGLFARFIPATALAVAAPVVVVVVVAALDPVAGGILPLAGCWCRWRWRCPGLARRRRRAISSSR